MPRRHLVQGDPPSYYKLGEKALIHLDIEGNVITGALAKEAVIILRKPDG